MKRWSRCTTLVVTILMVLAMSAMWAAPVLADDEAPPPPEATEVVPPPEENPSPEQPPGEAPTEVPVTDAQETPPVEETPPAEETPPTEETPVATEEAVESAEAAPAVEEAPTEVPAAEETSEEEPAPEAETPAEVLAQLPENTEVVILDENGEALSMASQEAEDILYSGDPMWCPVGVTPGGAGCTASFASLNLLVSSFVPTTNGVIWIQNVDVTTAAVTIDGTPVTGNWASAANYSLTFKGGWSGSGSTITSTPSTIDNTLNITSWNGSITMSDIVFSGVTSGTALNVSTTGNISLTRVVVGTEAAPNSGAGAVLDNSAGTGNITIKNSEFSYNNGGDGLNVTSNGTIKLNNVNANHNGGHGANLDNDGAATAKNVALTGTNIFSENTANGLTVSSRGAITISNLIVNSNGGWGASLNNTAATTALGVTLTGSSQFKFNGGGLTVASLGAITLNNITASHNTVSNGVQLNNSASGAGSNVMLTGTNRFNGNALSGITVLSAGNMTLNNVTANNNGLTVTNGYGAYLDNLAGSGGKSVVLTGVNVFNSNDSGLLILSEGTIQVSKVTANDNQNGGGVELNNSFSLATSPKNVTALGYVNVSGNTSGLYVWSYGSITLSSITAIGNTTGSGAYLDNCNENLGACTTITPKAVTLTGTNTFNDNQANGVVVESMGAITLNNVNANRNVNGYGAYLNNDWTGAVGGITVQNAASFWPSFSYNGDSGIIAYSTGNIILKDLDAAGNGGYGAYLMNTSGAASSVTVGTSRLHWCNGFSENGDSGLEIYTNGAVTLSSLCNSDNGGTSYGYGLYVDNTTAATPLGVTLRGSNSFDGNYSGGSYIFTSGAITIDHIYSGTRVAVAGSITANNNQTGLGALLDNNVDPASPQNVTIKGYGDFDGNAGRGLEIITFGKVTLSKIYAANNANGGVFIDNYTGATAVKDVKIGGYVEVVNNGTSDVDPDYGLYIHTLGAITLANLTADSNEYGVWLDNNDGTTPRGVTITGGAFTSENDNFGLLVTTRGAILFTLTDAWIYNNGTYGWYLDNCNAAGINCGTSVPAPITLTVASGSNIDFSENGAAGLTALSLGDITAVNLDAWDNGGYGVWLDNSFNGSTGIVSVTTTGGDNNYTGNGGTGLTIYSNRSITINNLYTEGNGGSGAILNNSSSGESSPQNVTVNGYGTFNANGDDGLAVFTFGNITLSNITANNNGLNADPGTGWGAYLDNCLYSSGSGTCTAEIIKGIKLKGTNTFNGNTQDGLWVNTLGKITASKVTASSNDDEGASLNNQWDIANMGVTLSGTNTFEGNGGDGLDIWTNGAVTISNLTASWNGGDGAYIDAYNDVTAPGGKVTLTGNNTFIGNGDGVTDARGAAGTGLTVFSDSVITINNLTASENTQDGAYLIASNGGAWGPFAVNLTLTGENTFNDNGLTGLYFYSPDNASFTKVTADGNGEDGVFGQADGNISLTCGSMTNNGVYGWSLNSGGTVTLTGVFAYGNTTANTNPVAGTFVYVRTCSLP